MEDDDLENPIIKYFEFGFKVAEAILKIFPSSEFSGIVMVVVSIIWSLHLFSKSLL